jgi:hypothetical protein
MDKFFERSTVSEKCDEVQFQLYVNSVFQAEIKLRQFVRTDRM